MIELVDGERCPTCAEDGNSEVGAQPMVGEDQEGAQVWSNPAKSLVACFSGLDSPVSLLGIF